MLPGIDIENIEELRIRQGIDDIELRLAIRDLKSGDFVKLTLVTEGKAASSEFLLVRITSVKGPKFRGKIAGATTSRAAVKRSVGAAIVFEGDHIHSIPTRPARG